MPQPVMRVRLKPRPLGSRLPNLHRYRLLRGELVLRHAPQVLPPQVHRKLLRGVRRHGFQASEA